MLDDESQIIARLECAIIGRQAQDVGTYARKKDRCICLCRLAEPYLSRPADLAPGKSEGTGQSVINHASCELQCQWNRASRQGLIGAGIHDRSPVAGVFEPGRGPAGAGAGAPVDWVVAVSGCVETLEG